MEKKSSRDSDCPEEKPPLTAESTRPRAHTRRRRGVSWLPTPPPRTLAGVREQRPGRDGPGAAVIHTSIFKNHELRYLDYSARQPQLQHGGASAQQPTHPRNAHEALRGDDSRASRPATSTGHEDRPRGQAPGARRQAAPSTDCGHSSDTRLERGQGEDARAGVHVKTRARRAAGGDGNLTPVGASRISAGRALLGR